MHLIGGGLLLYFGAEWFVAGASALALALRIPQILVGLTVVAYGTSAPEVIVGVQAARAGYGAIALGNVIGSNIANIGLILGITATIAPARVDGSLRRRELPVLLASATLVPLLLLDGAVNRLEAGCAAHYRLGLYWVDDLVCAGSLQDRNSESGYGGCPRRGRCGWCSEANGHAARSSNRRIGIGHPARWQRYLRRWCGPGRPCPGNER
jgi:hypothetical protein